jgi:hypothetical protein
MKRVPHGQPKFTLSAHTEGLVLRSSNGKQTLWRLTGEYAERRDRGMQPATPTGCRPSRWIPNASADWTLVGALDGIAWKRPCRPDTEPPIQVSTGIGMAAAAELDWLLKSGGQFGYRKARTTVAMINADTTATVSIVSGIRAIPSLTNAMPTRAGAPDPFGSLSCRRPHQQST